MKNKKQKPKRYCSLSNNSELDLIKVFYKEGRNDRFRFAFSLVPVWDSLIHFEVYFTLHALRMCELLKRSGYKIPTRAIKRLERELLEENK